jgi:cbb3-type cytochrome c oxidase subunit I/cbb3-type cytochrome c oxidase subunit II
MSYDKPTLPAMSLANSAWKATEDGLVRAHGLAALAMVVYSALLGLAIGLKFHWPDFLGGQSWLTWGRLRPGHTQGILFGWLGNAFLAYLYHAVPRLAGRPVSSRRLGWVLFGVWNFLLVIPGWLLVMAGISQPLEWAEFPLVTDVFAVLSFALMAVQFVVPFFRVRFSELYVAAWYILGAIVFTLLAYPVGNFAPELVPGARGATYSGLWIHDAVGLYVTPFAVSIIYFVVPAVTGKPIFSHFLSMLAFWMLFFIYPLNGTHHYIFSSIPMAAQMGAIVASIYLGMDVTLNVTNQLLSLRGCSGVTARDVPLRYVWASIVFYLLVSLQGSWQALMPVNRLVHFTDWVIGHSHLSMIGFASFAAIGGLLHAWKRTPGVRYNERAANWSFWLLNIGLLLMASDLTIAGLLQGALWQSEAAWMDSVRASSPYWTFRSVAALPLLAGFAALGLALLTGPVGETVAAESEETEQTRETFAANVSRNEGRGIAWLKNAYVLTALAGFGFFLFSFVVLAVWPNRELEGQIASTRPPQLASLSAAELHGQAVYAREGCLYCHTQLVRFTLDDVRRFGVATQAWETDRQYPQMWGTRRIGPDLARESGRRSKDWQLTHLWNPRFVVPDSIMPSYPWLFDGSASKPTKEALDLVAYVDFLGRDARLAGLEQQRPAMDPAEEERMGLFCDCAIPRTSGPAPLFSTRMPPSELRRFSRRGEAVFSRECSGCHGSAGKGDGPAAESLRPSPRDLMALRFSDRLLSDLLWNGVPGSSMPRFHELPASELKSLVVYVRSLEPEPQEKDALTAVERQRAEGLYGKNCVSCHGYQGRGDGLSAAVLAPRPTNFQQEQPTLAYAENALARGVAGTAMPPWQDKLNADERRLLARYLRSLYQPTPSERE